MDPDLVDGVRRFNRTVTQRIGALDDAFLARVPSAGRGAGAVGDRPAGRDVRALRERLDLDSGYLSRLLRGLERDGLVRVEPSAADGRVRTARLTEAGQAERAALDRLSDDAAAALLAPLSGGQRTRLVDRDGRGRAAPDGLGGRRRAVPARGTRTPGSACTPTSPSWPGGSTRGSIPARSSSAADAEMTPPAGVLLVATLHGEPVGCGALKFHGGAPAEAKRMWVAPSARGLGLGRRLLAELEAHAAAEGVRTVRLETNRALAEAIGLYRAAGYREVAPFNDEHYAHHWFEKQLPRPRTLA